MIILWWWKESCLRDNLDEWYIEGSKGTDKVILIDEKNSPDQLAFICQLARKNLQGGDVFIFLHRSHGYNQSAVNSILKQLKDQVNEKHHLRCFLFGEGYSYLYISKQPKGLLGSKGTFTARFLNGNGHNNGSEEQDYLISAIANERQRLLKKSHFDYVWNYYAFSFKAKIFELKEDFFGSIMDYLVKQEISAGELYHFLKLEPNRLLLLRLLSFVGKMKKGSDLESDLKAFEIRSKKSYLFDDYNENIKLIYGEEEQVVYKTLVTGIKQSVLGASNPPDLNHLRDQFEALLGAMPEATYYN